MVGLIRFGKTGSHSREITEIFKQKEIDKAYKKLEKALGSQKALDDFFKWKKDRDIVKMSKCKTTTKSIYTLTNNKVNMVKKVNIGSKKDDSDEKPEEQPEEQPERTIEDTDGTWLSKSKNGKAIFVTIPVDDLNKMEISKYTNKDGDVVEQVQLVTSVESLERVLSEEIKGTKLGYFKTK